MRCLQLHSAIILLLFSLTHSARILGIIQMPAYSHFQLGDIIFRELASRGHEVTVITPHALKEPVKNLKHIVLTDLIKDGEDIKKDFLSNVEHINILKKIITTDVLVLNFFVEYALKHQNVQNLLKSNEKFDLVIYENFLNEAFAGFAYHYAAPSVLLSTIGPSRWTNSKMGNPHNPAYWPDHYSSYSSTMSLSERLVNSLVYVIAELFTHLYMHKKQNELLQKYFPGAPNLEDLMYNSSIMLLNSHPSLGAAVPLVPNMIEIAGYHVQPPKPLPKDLQDYLDEGTKGVVLFSMGSNMKSVYITKEKRTAIINSFKQVKQKVLWKWEDDVLPDQPSNVKLAKWLPQQDILAHPNIKLLITHGGLLSTIEAVYHGVPVLGIPVFGDQELNINRAKSAGYGLCVPYKDLTEETLSTALHELLTNEKYFNNAKWRSQLLHDQQTKPLDRAIYWIEYVIRHRGAPHLKTTALSLRWYQYLLLDVIAVVAAPSIIVIWIVCKVVKFLCCKKSILVVSENKKRS